MLILCPGNTYAGFQHFSVLFTIRHNYKRQICRPVSDSIGVFLTNMKVVLAHIARSMSDF